MGAEKKGRPSEYREEFCEIAYNLMKEGASIVEVCAEIGISRETFYDWTNTESTRYKPIFSDTIKKGLLQAQAWWERNGRKAAFDSEGFNAVAYIFTMKNRFKKDYSDTVKQEINTTTPLVITLDKSELNGEANGSV